MENAMKRKIEDNNAESVLNQMTPTSSSGDEVSQNCGNNADEMFDPVTVFPVEIWEMVLNFVQDSKSVHNVFLAYPSFPAKFGRQIPLWMFEQVFPHIFPYLTKQDVQSCINVCSTWRCAISKFAEEHPSRRPYNGNLENCSVEIGSTSTFSLPRISRILVTEFGTLPCINKFLHMNPRHMNPFVGRYVSLETCMTGRGRVDFDNFRTNIQVLLQENGKHIWYFKIMSGFETAVQFYDLLKICLSLLPNLRSLHVVTGRDSRSKKYEVSKKPLPPLPCLESLMLDWETDVRAGRIFVALVRYYATHGLRYLSVPSVCWNDEVTQLFATYPEVSLGGLTDLHVDDGHSMKETNLPNLIPWLSAETLQKLKISGTHRGSYLAFHALDRFQFRVLELDWSRQCRPDRPPCRCSSGCKPIGSCKPVPDNANLNLLFSPKLQIIRIKHEIGISYRLLAWTRSNFNLEITVPNSTEIFMKLNVQRVCVYDEITKELHRWIYQEVTADNSLLWKLVPGLQSLKLILENPRLRRLDGRKIVFVHQRSEFLP